MTLFMYCTRLLKFISITVSLKTFVTLAFKLRCQNLVNVATKHDSPDLRKENAFFEVFAITKNFRACNIWLRLFKIELCVHMPNLSPVRRTVFKTFDNFFRQKSASPKIVFFHKLSYHWKTMAPIGFTRNFNVGGFFECCLSFLANFDFLGEIFFPLLYVFIVN